MGVSLTTASPAHAAMPTSKAQGCHLSPLPELPRWTATCPHRVVLVDRAPGAQRPWGCALLHPQVRPQVARGRGVRTTDVYSARIRFSDYFALGSSVK